MLKGLEVSEVKLSEIDLGDRMDADYFEKNNLHIEQMLRKVRAKELRGFAYFVASAFYPAATQLYSIGDTPFIRCVDCINYPLITKRQDDTFEKIPMSFVLENDGINLLNRNDIVITKVGSPCYASLVYEHNVVALSRTVMGLKNINGINPFYLLVFLRSKYGFSQLLRARELTIQYQLTLERVKRIRIFVPEESLQLQIEQMVKSAHAKLEESKQLYTEAENMLLEELGLKNWQPKNENINVKTLSESFSSSGRWDAEYYQSKYDEIENKIKTNCNYTRLGDCFNIHSNPSPKQYFNSGIKVIKTKNIRIPSIDFGAITDCTIDDCLKIEKNDLLFASMGVGSLGRMSFVFETNEDCTIDGTIKLLRTKEQYRNLNIEIPSLMFLTSKIGQELIYKNIIGSTGIISISKESIENLTLPIINYDICTKITNMVFKSFALKKESKFLLEQAKTMVENEIEKGV